MVKNLDEWEAKYKGDPANRSCLRPTIAKELKNLKVHIARGCLEDQDYAGTNTNECVHRYLNKRLAPQGKTSEELFRARLMLSVYFWNERRRPDWKKTRLYQSPDHPFFCPSDPLLEDPKSKCVPSEDPSTDESLRPLVAVITRAAEKAGFPLRRACSRALL